MQIKEMYRLIAEPGYILVDPEDNVRGQVVDLAPGKSPDGWTETEESEVEEPNEITEGDGLDGDEA